MEDINFKIVVFEHNFQHGPIFYQDEFGSFVSSFKKYAISFVFLFTRERPPKRDNFILKQILNDRLQIKNDSFVLNWLGSGFTVCCWP